MKSLILAVLLLFVGVPMARADEAPELSKKEKKELEYTVCILKYKK